MRYKYIIFMFLVNIFPDDQDKNILSLSDLLTLSQEDIKSHYQNFVDNAFNSMSSNDQKKHDKLNKNHDKNEKYNSYINFGYDELIYIRKTIIKSNLGVMNDIDKLEQKISGFKIFIDDYIEKIYRSPMNAYYNDIHNEGHTLTYDTKHFKDAINDIIIYQVNHQMLPLYIEFLQGKKDLYDLYNSAKIDLSNIIFEQLTILNDIISQQLNTAELIIDRQKKSLLQECQMILNNIGQDMTAKINYEVKTFDFILDQKINTLIHNSWQLTKMITVSISSLYFLKQLYDLLFFTLEQECKLEKKKENKYLRSLIIDKITFLKKCFYLVGIVLGIKYIIKKEKTLFSE